MGTGTLYKHMVQAVLRKERETMNNARMTFRFDQRGHGSSKSRNPDPQPEQPHLAQPSLDQPATDEPAPPISIPELPRSVQSTPDRTQKADKAPEDIRTLDEQYRRDIQRYDASTIQSYNTDYSAWGSAFDAEVQRLEQLIRSSHPNGKTPPLPEPEYNPETGYYETGHIVPVVEDEEPTSRRPKLVPPSINNLGRIAASLAGVLVTGTLFGWFVLSMFFADGGRQMADTFPPPVTGLPGMFQPDMQELSDRVSGTGERPGGASQDAPGAGPGGVLEPAVSPIPNEQGQQSAEDRIPAAGFVILQHGVFSSESAARDTQEKLKDHGFVGVGELDGKYYIYLGIAANRDEAIILKHRLDQANLETYMKEYDLPALSSIKGEGEQKHAAVSYLNKGNDLARMISRMTAAQWEKASPSPYDAETFAGLRRLHQEWTEASAPFAAGLGEEDARIVSRMDNAMNTAVVALDAFQKNTSESLLWQAQAGITQYLVLERGLRASLAAK